MSHLVGVCTYAHKGLSHKGLVHKCPGGPQGHRGAHTYMSSHLISSTKQIYIYIYKMNIYNIQKQIKQIYIYIYKQIDK